MRIKVAIDVDIPPRVKRLLLWGIPIGIITAGGIAWASLPHTFVSGETLTAANLNADFQNLDTRLGAVESVRIVYGQMTAAGTVTNQVPAGWVTTSVTPGGGCSSTEDYTLTFSPPFSAAPSCTLPDVGDGCEGAGWTITAGSAVASNILSPPTATVVCVGPR
jgi:hypothetical protein